MLHSLKKTVLTQKVIALENSSFCKAFCAQQDVNKSPLSEGDASAIIPGFLVRGKAFALSSGRTKSQSFVGLIGKRKIQEILGIFWVTKPKKKMMWLILILFPFIFHLLYLISICLDV